MRIGNTNRSSPISEVSPARKSESRDNASEPAVRNVADVTSVMGIPANELTPKVREAIMQLMAEVDRMRQEIEKQQARIAYLEQLADQDSLTPVANRRAFVRELSRIMSYSERYDTPSSIVYVDLNDLKAINDTHGHAAGDAALTQIAKILIEQVRESDIVGRLGGDEFGVLLSHADEATAAEKALQLVEKIEETPLEWQSIEIPLRVAFGTYTFRGEGNAGEALDAADRAMYAHKNAGR